jgi:type IV fimbrial biogenesis protein FimT
MIPLLRSRRGFTLIELMVTLTVILVLMLIAIPSFQSFRQRAAVRAASEQVLAFWNQARMESAKRNTWVKFARQVSGSNYCVGAAVASSAADTTACNCFQTDAAQADYCTVAHWPASSAAADQAEWRGTSLASPTAATNLGTVVLDPKVGSLTTASTPGAFAILGPASTKQYKLYLTIDALGRGVLCQPDNAVGTMSDYTTRTCAN